MQESYLMSSYLDDLSNLVEASRVSTAVQNWMQSIAEMQVAGVVVLRIMGFVCFCTLFLLTSRRIKLY